MKLHVAFVSWLLLVLSAQALAADAADEWGPVRRFLGEWTGVASGRPGGGTVTRRYAFVVNDRYLHETNLTQYAPLEANKPGEKHEHWSIFSIDKARKLVVLRQFHGEGFINTYRQTSADDTTLVFVSESFENFDNAWRARETYVFASDDEFVETFELAPPGKPFGVYSRVHFKRAGR